MAASEVGAPSLQRFPPPPGLDWYWILFLDFPTFSLFSCFWLAYLALWLLRVNRGRMEITVLLLLSISLILKALDVIWGVLAIGWRYYLFPSPVTPWASILAAGVAVTYLVGIFMMRHLLEHHYSEARPMGLRLDAFMTLFFAPYYFQYHLHKIAEFQRRHAE
jgi:hypothetical protein